MPNGTGNSGGEQELWDIIASKEITKIVYAGEAEDMCVMQRPFGINNLRARGWSKDSTVVIRDLVLNLYNPADQPYVSTTRSQAIFTDYIESFWGVTVSSNAFLVPWYHAHPGGFVPVDASGGGVDGVDGGNRARGRRLRSTTDAASRCSVAMTSGGPCRRASSPLPYYGGAYGCRDNTMWVSGGCDAVFTCNGIANITCASANGLYGECACAKGPPDPNQPPEFNLTIRQRALDHETGTTRWLVNDTRVQFKASEMALVVVDMWDQHWCSSVTERTGEMAIKINRTANVLRDQGAAIIWAPSQTTSFYDNTRVRNRTLALPRTTVPPSAEMPQPAFPISTSTNGGCDVNERFSAHQVWTRQISTLVINQERDYLISAENGTQELWNIVRAKKLKRFFYVGEAEDMCVMNRPFGIRNLRSRGVAKDNVVIFRDAVYNLFNPVDQPYVSEVEAQALMTNFIEMFWASSALAGDVLEPWYARHANGVVPTTEKN